MNQELRVLAHTKVKDGLFSCLQSSSTAWRQNFVGKENLAQCFLKLLNKSQKVLNMSVATSHHLVSFFCFVSGGKQQSSHRRREQESQQAHPVDEEACISLFYPSSPSLCHHTHTLTAHRQNSVQRNPSPPRPHHPHPRQCACLTLWVHAWYKHLSYFL